MCLIRAYVCCQNYQFALGGINSVNQPNWGQQLEMLKKKKSQKDKMAKPLFISPVVPFKC